MTREEAIDKPHIKGDYYDGYKNGIRTAEWRCGKIRKEINQLPITDTAIRLINEIFDKYMDESEVKKMTREEAIEEVNKAFKPAFANYIITALTEGATVSDKEQEPFKPMAEINLYSVIKQKYIEREVLDKIRVEIKEKFEGCDICEWLEDYDYEENDISEYQSVGDIEDILQIIDKYKGRK